MRWLRRLAIVGFMLADAGIAIGADLPRMFAPPPVNFGYGWYLRGDLGYAWGGIGGAQSAPGFADPTGNDLGGGFVGGIGGGIKSRWLRADVTVDYTAPLNYTGSVAAPDDTTAKVGAVSALFNGYIDLGTWYRITPYVGGGIGAAQVRVSDYASTGAPPFTGDASRTQYNMAWAVMAGIGYVVAPNIVVDAGYRYVNFGDVTTGSDSLGAMTLKNIDAHEVRVGFRWSFDDLPLVH